MSFIKGRKIKIITFEEALKKKLIIKFFDKYQFVEYPCYFVDEFDYTLFGTIQISDGPSEYRKNCTKIKGGWLPNSFIKPMVIIQYVNPK